MDDQRCATCKWWTDVLDEWGSCALTVHENFGPVHPESLAYAVDAENYYADLECRATFGCVQYQPKEQE